MVSAATEYRKNGFNDQDAAQLAQVSSMFQNVADESISTGDAAQFLISQLIAFNQNTGDVAGNAMHIVDALNEVANNFAVGTGDLATGLKVVASTSSAMGNSLEQTIGLMTAITEQTKNASKASRGLNAIMANLAQVLDPASSNGEKIVAIFNKLGVSMYDTNGQLKSGFDLLQGLYEKWGTLDSNTQKYIATTIAGTTQLNNFLALMNNFDHTVNATNTALDSQGSAMRENSAYMESIQAKLFQLQSTFQDFANNIISSDLAKAVLDLANALLRIANTDLGQIVTQIVLLTGLGWGATSLVKALGIFKTGAKQFLVLTGAIEGVGTAASVALPIILGVATALAVGGALWKATEDSRKGFEELNADIEANTTTLKTNKQRLEKLNSIPWYDRTPEIENEIAKIEAENKELENQIQYYKDLNIAKAREVAGASYEVYDESSGYHVGGLPGKIGAFGASSNYSSREDLVSAIYGVYGADSKWAEILINNIEEIGEVATLSGQDLDEYLTKAVLNYNSALESGNEPSQTTIDLYNKNKDTIIKLADSYRTMKANGETLTGSQQALLDAVNATFGAYGVATENTEKTTNALKLNADQVDAIKSKYPKLAESIIQVGDSYYLTNNAAVSAASGLVNANGKIYKSAKDTAKQTLEQLQTIIDGYKTVAQLGLKVYLADRTEENLKAYQQSYALLSQVEAASNKLKIAIAKSEKEGYDDDSNVPTFPSSTKKYTDKALEQFKSLQKDIEHQLNLGKITEEEYYNQLEELVKQYKINATAHMKEYGLTVNQINQNMYSYEEKIYEGRAKLAEELAAKQEEEAKKVAEAQKAALEQQKSDYETAASYVVKKIEEEISKLEQQKSDIEKFYDDQIQALQDTNDELERQIQYEQLLNNMAQAKDKGLYVFSNGQFQYMQDVEAISAAQAELDAYERDKALRKETENLNNLKDQAVAAIDEQIKSWEKYKEEWSNVVNQYTESQNKLIVEQVLGIDLEQANWEKRLENAQTFANKYNSILSRLSSIGLADDDEPTGKKVSSTTRRSAVESKLAQSKISGKSESLGGGVSVDYSRIKGHASGTLSASGGLSLVGENGPELRVLGQGDGVIPADVTRNLWDWGKINPNNIGGNTTHIFNIDNLTLPNVNDAKSLMAGLKNLAYQRAYKRA